MQHGVALAHQRHHLIPGAIQRGAGAVHGVLDAAFPDQTLDVGDLGGDGGGWCSNRD